MSARSGLLGESLHEKLCACQNEGRKIQVLQANCTFSSSSSNSSFSVFKMSLYLPGLKLFEFFQINGNVISIVINWQQSIFDSGAVLCWKQIGLENASSFKLTVSS